MQKLYEITLVDVFGGDGNIRWMDVEEPTLTRRKTTKRTRDDIGVSVSSASDEVVTQKVKKEVQTFRYEDGKPMLRLGGVHGKLWGALREARNVLYALGRAEYRSTRLLDTIQVQPIWVTLEMNGELRLEKLPQILNVMGRSSMIVQYYDVIPEGKARISLSFPDQMEKQVEGLLSQVAQMGILNKRRATIKTCKLLEGCETLPWPPG